MTNVGVLPQLLSFVALLQKSPDTPHLSQRLDPANLHPRGALAIA
ncbi:hypothetical protein [Oscillatoria sp. FACHB-1407]|nr:hypothetical protein [Oscillatoria sp. FACHB-1407]